jgi:hypothetical protein
MVWPQSASGFASVLGAFDQERVWPFFVLLSRTKVELPPLIHKGKRHRERGLYEKRPSGLSRFAGHEGRSAN